MTQVDRLLEANADYVPSALDVTAPRPARKLAVVTCMDARIDVFAALGLRLGDAHVLRNAGGRITDDVLRSLALSVHVLGIDTAVVIHHTQCGLEGAMDADLKRTTGADLEFLAIEDHPGALREDVELLTSRPYLEPLALVAGLLYDLTTGKLTEIVRWEGPSPA